MSGRTVSLAELRAHNTKDELWILLHDKVYDVTKFLDEPGGDEVIIAESGQDASDAFEDVGHSDEARDFLPAMLVGTFENNGVQVVPNRPAAAYRPSFSSSGVMYWAPLGLLAAWFGYRFYRTGAPY